MMPTTRNQHGGDLPYHERQTPLKQLCLMHALNMFVGEPRLNQAYMDQVCDQLVSTSPAELQQEEGGGGGSLLLLSKLSMMTSSSNPHKGKWLGGNYDVNVAIYILENEWNYQVKYYQKNNDSSNEEDEDASCSSLESMDGLLVNVPGFFPWTRHWIVYKQWSSSSTSNDDSPQCWYRLDSKASGPVPISKNNIHLETDKQVQTGNTVLTIRKRRSKAEK